MLELNGLTTKEVARLCRVSDATVKRWEEAGLLKSERTSGGHRRFRAEEVARFQRRQKIGLKPAGGESTRAALRHRRVKKSYAGSVLFHSLLAGREDEAGNILIGAHLRGEPAARIFDDSICPALRRVGELWFDGEINVAQEHLATRAACNAIYKLRENVATVDETNGKLAFCCALEGDFHELPTHFAQITLENAGWEVMNFGANTPLYWLIDEVLHHTPEIVCIAAAIMGDYERLARDYKEFRARIAKLKIPVVLGGRAFATERVRARFPAELYAENFTELAQFVKSSKIK